MVTQTALAKVICKSYIATQRTESKLMSKQLALAITFSVMATVGLALFAVDPINGVSGPSGHSVISVETAPLPALSQLLPSLQ